MKIKTIIAALGLTFLGIVSTAFVQKTPQKTNPLEEAKKEAFLEFLSQFKKVELPYSMGLDEVKATTQAFFSQKPIAKREKGMGETPFIPETHESKFSRGGAAVVTPVARFYPNSEMVAVIYKSNRPFEGLGDEYKMLVYDLKGNFQPKVQNKTARVRPFNLGHIHYNSTMTFSIGKDGHISQSNYENQWEKDARKHGFQDNKITHYKPNSTMNYSINNKGEFSELKSSTTASRAEP